MHKDYRDGFTLVELSLSIVFIATLSIAVALIISNSIATYRRGLTLNTINTVGMEIVDDVRGAIQDAPSRPVAERCTSIYNEADWDADYCLRDGGLNFVSLTREGKVRTRLGGEEIESVAPVFGALCTGDYSYIWNSGYYFNGSNARVEKDESGRDVGPAVFSYRAKSDQGEDNVRTMEGFKLLKIRDVDRSVCISKVVDEMKYYDPKAMCENGDIDCGAEGTTVEKENISGVFDVSDSKYIALSEEPIDVLSQASNLALYDFNSAEPVNGNNGVFYDISFILGTIQGGVNVIAENDYCVAPGDYKNTEVENFNYCAINKFNFAVRAIGGNNEIKKE